MPANTEYASLGFVEKDKISEVLDSQTLPKTTTTDNGKVLTVKGGKWTKAAPGGLPSVTAKDNGKVLMVVDGKWAAVKVD